jgi:hypothetical protein
VNLNMKVEREVYSAQQILTHITKEWFAPARWLQIKEQSSLGAPDGNIKNHYCDIEPGFAPKGQGLPQRDHTAPQSCTSTPTSAFRS